MNRIVRWDGSAWLPLGAGIEAAAEVLAVYEGELIAGGQFVMAGGEPADRIARWGFPD